MKKKLSLLILIIGVSALSGCGIQGPPRPPLTPPELGNGRPSFTRATQGFKFSEVPPVQSEPAAKSSPNEIEP